MTLSAAYSPSVNESETITDAQPVYEGHGCETRGFRIMAFEFPVMRNIERS